MKTVSVLLKEKKLKLTPQRLAIFNMLINTNSHPTAEIIHKSLSDTHPSMSLATVYKTLDSLKNVGLVQEINVGEDSFRYDANCGNHFHIVCNYCSKIFDFEANSDINNKTIDILKNNIKEETDFEITNEQIFFYGKCKDCQ